MLDSLSPSQLVKREAELSSRFAHLPTRGQQLNMARGKPSPEQLVLANPMRALPINANYLNDEGIDCRSYGGIDGLPEMKQLFGGILDCPVQNIIVGGNSSLSMMHDALMRTYIWGGCGGIRPGGNRVRFVFCARLPDMIAIFL